MYLVDNTCVFLCTMLGHKVGKLTMNTYYSSLQPAHGYIIQFPVK